MLHTCRSQSVHVHDVVLQRADAERVLGQPELALENAITSKGFSRIALALAPGFRRVQASDFWSSAKRRRSLISTSRRASTTANPSPANRGQRLATSCFAEGSEAGLRQPRAHGTPRVGCTCRLGPRIWETTRERSCSRGARPKKTIPLGAKVEGSARTKPKRTTRGRSGSWYATRNRTKRRR